MQLGKQQLKRAKLLVKIKCLPACLPGCLVSLHKTYCWAHNVREVSVVDEGLVVVSGLCRHLADMIIHDPILLPHGMTEVDIQRDHYRSIN